MWKATAAQDLKNAFDDVIEKAYGHGRNGELENLADLFDDAVVDNYQRALLLGLTAKSSVNVDVAWIDKRPIAKIRDKGAGAELGDMMLVVRETYPGGVEKSRACLLEVKQSPTQAIPAVPVTSGKSTDNQYEILSTWPTLYGLKTTGSNKEYILKNITTQPGAAIGGVLAQAWYVAVKPPSTTTLTSDPWMAAPAKRGALFEHTLGDIFSACARGAASTNTMIGHPIAVGRDFDRSMTLPSFVGWDALINKIIRVTKSYDLPPSLFPYTPKKRYITGWQTVPVVAIGGFDFLSGPPTLSGIWIGVHAALITFAIFRFLMERRKRFPVLFFYIDHSESQG